MNFRELLIHKEITMTQLAKEIGVSKHLVSHWARGKGYPQLPQIVALSKALNESLETIIKCFIKEV